MQTSLSLISLVQEHFIGIVISFSSQYLTFSNQMLLRYINLRFDVKGNKQRLSGDARKAFFNLLHWFKKICLFEQDPTEEDLYYDLENNVLDEIWDILPPIAYSVVVYAM